MDKTPHLKFFPLNRTVASVAPQTGHVTFSMY